MAEASLLKKQDLISEVVSKTLNIEIKTKYEIGHDFESLKFYKKEENSFLDFPILTIIKNEETKKIFVGIDSKFIKFNIDYDIFNNKMKFNIDPKDKLFNTLDNILKDSSGYNYKYTIVFNPKIRKE
ncbi:MAG: hypothetical protein ACP5RI_01610 [Candidatus Micrarchaeia archaeon]